MNPQHIVEDTRTKLNQAIEHFKVTLQSLRTSRANASMLDGVVVEVYGTAMPLMQVANIVAPEAQLLQITPFDPNNLQAIAAAIRNNAALGFNPTDDGRVVRVNVPPLTEERRHELAKQIGQKQEDCMVSIRSIRHDALDLINQSKKEKMLGEDDAKRLIAQIEDAMNSIRGEVEQASKMKEKEVMTL